MDKIWDRKSFEVGGHWPLWRGWKNEWTRRTEKSWMLKKSFKQKIVDPSCNPIQSIQNMTQKTNIIIDWQAQYIYIIYWRQHQFWQWSCLVLSSYIRDSVLNTMLLVDICSSFKVVVISLWIHKDTLFDWDFWMSRSEE